MQMARPGLSVQRKLQWFCLMNLLYSSDGISGMCDSVEFQYSSASTPGGRKASAGKKNFTSGEPLARLGTRKDAFYEAKPDFISPVQWDEWKKRYGFAPLGEFCDNCRQVPGKCRHLQICQDYCAEDCYGHGKDLTINILCSWCEGARDKRCKNWRSCRKHCELLCLHERYRLKVETDLQKEREATKKRRTQLYEEYLRKKEEEEKVWLERQTTLRKQHLEETRKRLAKLAELEYRPPKEEL